ncbi:MAG: ATPase [Pseudomonadota bacterium]
MGDARAMEVSLRTPDAEVFAGAAAKLSARGLQGRFAMLPAHADMVAPLLTGVVGLTFAGGAERFFGVDEGVLVKQGPSVTVCVFRVVPGASLEEVRQTATARFGEIADRERRARTALARLEIGAMRRFADLMEPGA